LLSVCWDTSRSTSNPAAGALRRPKNGESPRTGSVEGPEVCRAIVDRLTFNGTIIETGIDSDRPARSRAKAEQAAVT
jgi:hypothetical protein